MQTTIGCIVDSNHKRCDRPSDQQRASTTSRGICLLPQIVSLPAAALHPCPLCTTLFNFYVHKRHGANKFKVDADVAYIKFSDLQAFFRPSLSIKDLTDKEQDALMTTVMTGAEWKACFNSISSGEKPEWLCRFNPPVFLPSGYEDRP
jgi:hypothetical protein